MPVQRPPIPMDRMVQGKNSKKLSRETKAVTSCEFLFTPEAIKELKKVMKVSTADWRAATLILQDTGKCIQQRKCWGN